MSFAGLTRRSFLGDLGSGLSGIALATLLDRNHARADSSPRSEFNGGLHHRARAKRVIQLFMNGGASQCDLFDYKPTLVKLHGQPFDPGAGQRVEASVSTPGAVMKSPFTWAQHGQCGRWVSSALPHTAKIVDDLAFLMAMNVEIQCPRAGRLSAKHRLRPARLSVHGGVDFVRPGQPARQRPGVRGAAGPARLAVQRPQRVHFRISAGEPSGHGRQRLGARSHLALAAAGVGEAHHAGKPDRGARPARRN